jgi:restriction endonuclease Mrr
LTVSAGAASNAGGGFAPTYLYWPAILQSLVDSGGSARGEQVTDQVGEKLKDLLRPADHERVSSGVLRWRNRVAWQRFNMIREGLLRGDSPRGVWEITRQRPQVAFGFLSRSESEKECVISDGEATLQKKKKQRYFGEELVKDARDDRDRKFETIVNSLHNLQLAYLRLP